MTRTLLTLAALVLTPLFARGQVGPHYLGIPQSTWTYEVADTVDGRPSLYFLDITALQPIKMDGHTWYRAEVVRRDDGPVAKDTVQVDSTRSRQGGNADSCGLFSWLPDTLTGPFPHLLTLEGREYRTRTQTCRYYDNTTPRYPADMLATSMVEEHIGLIYKSGTLNYGALRSGHRTAIRLRRFDGQLFDVDRFLTLVHSAVRRKSPDPAYSMPTSSPDLFLFEGHLHDTQGRIQPRPHPWRQAE